MCKRPLLADVSHLGIRGLLEAAAAFARGGLDAANINEISLSAGLAKGTVYNYFPSKEALFLAVVEQACAWAAEGAADPGADAPARERLRALLASDMAWAREHEAFARVLVRELFAGKPELYGRVVRAAAPYIGRVGVALGLSGAHRPVNGGPRCRARCQSGSSRRTGTWRPTAR